MTILQIDREADSPYDKGGYRTRIFVKWPHGGFLIWNWDLTQWDKVEVLP